MNSPILNHLQSEVDSWQAQDLEGAPLVVHTLNNHSYRGFVLLDHGLIRLTSITRTSVGHWDVDDVPVFIVPDHVVSVKLLDNWPGA